MIHRHDVLHDLDRRVVIVAHDLSSSVAIFRNNRRTSGISRLFT